MSEQALAAIDKVIGDGVEADDVLRTVVALLAGEPDIVWAGILFLDDGALTLGPEAGEADPTQRFGVSVRYEGTVVGQLAIDGGAETAFLVQIADRIATHVLLGWDTGGETWEP